MTQARIPLILILCTTLSFCASCGTNSGSSTSAQGTASPTPTVEVAKVRSKKLSIATRLPGELQAYEEIGRASCRERVEVWEVLGSSENNSEGGWSLERVRGD